MLFKINQQEKDFSLESLEGYSPFSLKI